MEERYRRALKRVRADLKKWMPGIIAASIFLFVMILLFGSTCISRILIGIPCPGCGLSRAALLFLKGDFAGSFRMQPLFLFLLPVVVMFLYERYFTEHGGRIGTVCLVIWLILLVVVYAVRMILHFPSVEPVTYYEGAILHLFPCLHNMPIYDIIMH